MVEKIKTNKNRSLDSLSLIFFLSANGSILNWEYKGRFDRELYFIKEGFLNKGVRCTVFSYGGSDEGKFKQKLSPINLIYNSFNFGAYIYID